MAEFEDLLMLCTHLSLNKNPFVFKNMKIGVDNLQGINYSHQFKAINQKLSSCFELMAIIISSILNISWAQRLAWQLFLPPVAIAPATAATAPATPAAAPAAAAPATVSKPH
ncbi:MAG TPA: hypothetical protein VGK06_08425 [Methanosarcina sp.]